MDHESSSGDAGGLSRRTFVKFAAAAVPIGGLVATSGGTATSGAVNQRTRRGATEDGGARDGPELFDAPTVAGKPVMGPIKVGVIGCGGRGTGAALQALRADEGVVLHAAGDVFGDRLTSCLANLAAQLKEDGGEKGESAAARAIVPEERRFVGFDAYQKVIDSGVDVVLLTSYPHFRPLHLRAAVRAGKHVFAEKPVAVDGPGLRSVLESVAESKRRGLACLVGFCWRYHDAMREIFNKINGGAIGEVVTVHTTYHTDTLSKRARKPEWSDTEFQLRNWWHFTWLSGDHVVEQAIHSIDRLAWALGDRMPTRVTCLGGRAARSGPEHGNVYDHFSANYEYEGGMRTFHSCRQIDGCPSDNTDYVFGTKGQAEINGWAPTYSLRDLTGKEEWKYSGRNDRDMYQNEHDALFASLRAGSPINDGERGANSTLMSIMARMSAYTGQTVTWKQALDSTERLGPESYTLGELATPEVAVPGRTKFS